MEFLSVAFTGPSNSGKTSAIVKIAEILSKDKKVAIIKHDPADKAHFDKEGKDSWKFSQTGAEVVVASPTRTTYFLNQKMDLEKIVNSLNPFDFLIVEGLRTLPLPRIGIFRNEILKEYLPFCGAIAVDGSVDLDKYDLPKDLHVMDLNDPYSHIEWIKKNAKKVR